MRRHRRARYVGRTAGAALVGAAIAAALLRAPTAPTAPTAPQLPACYEDAALVGAGSFSDGRWDRYVCGPAVDDLAPAPAGGTH